MKKYVVFNELWINGCFREYIGTYSFLKAMWMIKVNRHLNLFACPIKEAPFWDILNLPKNLK